MMKLSGEQIKGKNGNLRGRFLNVFIIKWFDDAECEDYGKRTDKKGCERYNKAMEIPENIFKSGFSGNIEQALCEQRMKPVKLQLKNCMNISSEDAAKNSPFIFSLIESCKLNDIAPQDYLITYLNVFLHDKDCDKKTLLPCFYKSECFKKMAGNRMITARVSFINYFCMLLRKLKGRTNYENLLSLTICK